MQEKTKRSRAQWAELMEAYEASDQTQFEFANANNVTISTFAYWRHKLRKEQASRSTTQPPPSFVELRAARESSVATVTVQIDAASITFSCLPDPQYLAAVLAGLVR